MIDTAQLREALKIYEWAEKSTDPDPISRQWRTVIDAARILLAQMEAGALIITPDEIVDTLSNTPLVERIAQVAGINKRTVALDILDALRDAMPDGDS